LLLRHLSIYLRQITKKMKKVSQKQEDIFLMLGQGKDWQVIQLSREGISKGLLFQLGSRINFTEKELATVLDLSERTLQRYTYDTKLSKVASEKTIELANLYQHGEEVFESIDMFNIWMKTPHAMFQKQRPIDILDTHRGFLMIHDELGRIEHGVYI
jgi:putative toxin-antitoxin system antitoxin component (TIGR02293 family)